jgi:hypothetical protein
MPPEQPPAQTPYDFITAPGQPNKINPLQKLPVSIDGIKKRVIIVAGGGILIIVIAIILYSFITSLGTANNSNVISVVEQQAVLLDLAGQANINASAITAKNLAGNIQISVQSAQTQFIKESKKVGQNMSQAQTTYKNSALDSQLTSALQLGTFDTTFYQIVQAQLSTYENDLYKAYKGSNYTVQKSLLINFDNQAKLLNSQAAVASQGGS